MQYSSRLEIITDEKGCDSSGLPFILPAPLLNSIQLRLEMMMGGRLRGSVLLLNGSDNNCSSQFRIDSIDRCIRCYIFNPVGKQPCSSL